MAQNALIVKSKFWFQTSGLYGVMALLFDIEKKILVEDHIYVSRFSDIANTDMKSSWRFLEPQLNNIQMQNMYSPSLTQEFKRYFKERLNANFGLAASIIVDYELNCKEKLYGSFEEMLTSVQKDKNVSLEFFYETISLEEIKAARELRVKEETQILNTQNEESNTSAIRIPDGNIMIKADPILSPLGGIPLVSLTPGTRILMRLNMHDTHSSHWAQFFKAYHPETKEVLPLVATVTQIGPIVNKNRDVVVSYGENISSRFNVETGIKLKGYDVFSKEMVVHPHLTVLDEKDKLAETKPSNLPSRIKVLPWVILGIGSILAITVVVFLVLAY